LFLRREKKKGATGKVPAEKKVEDIYSLCLRGKIGIWCATCAKNEDLFEC